MKRAFKYGILIAASAALLLLMVLIGWLFGTTGGTLWLMDAAGRYTSYSVTAEKVEGRLGRELRLQGLQVDWPRGELRVDALRFRWNPLLLLNGRISVGEIALNNVSVIDRSPKTTKPPDLSWPRIKGIPSWIYVRIRSLRIDNLRYGRAGEKPTVVGSLSLDRTRWRLGVLAVRRLQLTTPAVKLDGSVSAGFRRPSLLLKVTAIPGKPLSGVDKLLLDARLLPGRQSEQAAGPVSISALSGSREIGSLAGDLGITRNSFVLRKMQLQQSGRRGGINGEGTVSFLESGTMIRMQLALNELDLSPELKGGARLSGTLGVEGYANDYRGRLALQGKGEGWRKGSISANLSGDLNSILFEGIDGTLLAGKVAGKAGIDWKKGVAVKTEISVKGVNPGVLNRQWQGVLNAELKGEAAWSGGEFAAGSLKARILDSVMAGKTLSGEADLAMARQNLIINRLYVRGKGFDLKASGELEKRISFAAAITDLSGLVADSAGRIRANGWVRRNRGRFSGAVNASAGKVRVGSIAAASARIDGGFSDAQGYPLNLSATLKGVKYNQIAVESANLRAAGSLERHNISTEMTASDFRFSAIVNGGYKANVWQGQISRLQGRDAVGPWNLVTPAPFTISADTVRLPGLVIRGVGGEFLEAAVDLKPAPLRGSFRTEWRALNLARFAPLLGEMQVGGTSSGDLRVRLPGGGRIVAVGKMNASGTVTADGRKTSIDRASAKLNWNEKGMLTQIDVAVNGGLLKSRFTASEPARMAIPSRGVLQAELQGFDISKLRPWLPEGLDLGGIISGEARGELSPGVRFNLRSDARLDRGAIHWQRERDRLNASITRADITLSWQGAKEPRSGVFRTRDLDLKAALEASGTGVVEGTPIQVQKASLGLEWGERGVSGKIGVALADGGRLNASVFSPQPAGAALPEQGVIEADWRGIDLILLSPWLPGESRLYGKLSGKMAGSLVPGGNIELRGDTSITGGRARWTNKGGELEAAIQRAELSWAWRGETLGGNLSLVLDQYGQAKGSFQLPLPARMPVAFRRNGPIAVSFSGRVQEQGLLSSFLPGLVRESRGKLDFQISADGTYEKPLVSGRLRLTEAGAYLPSSGITLKNVQLNVSLEQDTIRVESMRVDSGPGHLEGTAVVRLRGGRPIEYRGSLKGERFQVVYLPELRVQAGPDLTFTGTPQKLTVRGDIQIPALQVLGRTAEDPIAPSSDVVLVGQQKAADKKEPFPLDVQVGVILGENVEVKAEGIDAKLRGRLNLVFTRLDEIRSTGQIRVVQGRYKAYGINLDITRGRIFYAGGRITEPSLDIQALRRVNDVRAGVAIVGNPKSMIVKLYSEPPLPENVILSYIVLGQPLAYNEQQAGRLSSTAGQLPSLTRGYRPIPTGPSRSTVGGGVSQSMLSIGRYLTPELYISFGRSLLTNGNQLRVRYSPTRRWEIETQTGTESGADIYYKINFN